LRQSIVICLTAVVTGLAWLAKATAQVSTASPANWTLVHDRPTAGRYEDFAFPTSSDGWLIAATGEILHTSDGGATWAVQANGKGRLRSVDFLDARRGFAGTLTGQLYGTTDGGATWSDVTSRLPHPPQGFCGMDHVGDDVHLVGRYYGNVADYFYSADGGKTWRVDDLHPMAQGLVEVVFIDRLVGFVGGMAPSTPVGQGPAIILKTSDGGRHWRPVFTHEGGRGFAWKIFPVSGTLIYVALQSQDGIYRIAKSIDNGETWRVLTVTTGQRMGAAIQGIGFLDERHGWVGGFFQGMYETTDGGETWAPVQATDRTINRFQKVGPTLFTAGSRGILRYDGPTK
jgi:photosystem II stability/assembly factor-like uncharacterized protein